MLSLKVHQITGVAEKQTVMAAFGLQFPATCLAAGVRHAPRVIHRVNLGTAETFIHGGCSLWLVVRATHRAENHTIKSFRSCKIKTLARIGMDHHSMASRISEWLA